MKKALSLILAVVMCLSLCACGGQEAKLYEKYSTLIEKLEEKDYEGAVMEIYEMYENDQAGGNTEGNGDTADGENDESSVDPNVTAAAEMLPGEWVISNYGKEDGNVNWVFNADGTATFGDETFEWTVDRVYESGNADILVTSNLVPKYEFSIWTQENGLRTASCSTLTESGDYADGVSGTWYRLNDMTVIEVTSENFADHFELAEYMQISRNAFDEPESVYIYFYLLLKEEYGEVVTEASEVAIDINITTSTRDYILDIENSAYTVGAEPRYEPSTYDDVRNMYSQYMEEDMPNRYGTSLTSASMSLDNEEIYGSYLDSYEINRASGTIYCVTPQN